MTLPIYNYPTSIAWVDDDQLFLKAIQQILEPQYTLKIFKDAKSSLDFFNQYEPHLPQVPFLQSCTDHDYYETAEHLPVDINAAVLSEFHQSLERKQDISVIVIDYHMPDMNGLELCEKLKDLPMKKILLTGAMGHTQAISAFNEGIIDRYIRKDDPSLLTNLHHYFNVLMNEYFIDSTKSLLSHLEIDHSLPISDPIFADFFKNWCEYNNIKEYFLIDKQGNFCVVDDDDKISYFIVHTDRTLSLFLDTYSDSKNSELINAVLARKKVPYFGLGKDGWQVDASKWAAHFYQPNLLEGKEQYYWVKVST